MAALADLLGELRDLARGAIWEAEQAESGDRFFSPVASYLSERADA